MQTWPPISQIFLWKPGMGPIPFEDRPDSCGGTTCCCYCLAYSISQLPRDSHFWEYQNNFCTLILSTAWMNNQRGDQVRIDLDSQPQIPVLIKVPLNFRAHEGSLITQFYQTFQHWCRCCHGARGHVWHSAVGGGVLTEAFLTLKKISKSWT